MWRCSHKQQKTRRDRPSSLSGFDNYFFFKLQHVVVSELYLYNPLFQHQVTSWLVVGQMSQSCSNSAKLDMQVSLTPNNWRTGWLGSQSCSRQLKFKPLCCQANDKNLAFLLRFLFQDKVSHYWFKCGRCNHSSAVCMTLCLSNLAQHDSSRFKRQWESTSHFWLRFSTWTSMCNLPNMLASQEQNPDLHRYLDYGLNGIEFIPGTSHS